MEPIPAFLLPCLSRPHVSHRIIPTRQAARLSQQSLSSQTKLRQQSFQARHRPTHPNNHTPSSTLPPKSQALHTNRTPAPVPDPTPFCPDPRTFLTLIGRNLSSHAAKFPDWPSLFQPDGAKLRELGLEPARDRRYLMAWRDRFRRGEWGVGGDLRFVSEGEAEGQRVARVVIAGVRTDTAAAAAAQQGSKGRQPEQSAVPTEKLTAAQLGAQAKVKQAIANVPLDWTPEQPVPELDGAPLKPALLKMNGTKTGIRGPGIEIVSGTNGREVLVKTREGLWEHKRGRKVDGGERRKDEVRAKRRIAANKER